MDDNAEITNEMALLIVFTADVIERGGAPSAPFDIFEYRLRDGRRIGDLTISELHTLANERLRERPDLLDRAQEAEIYVRSRTH